MSDLNIGMIGYKFMGKAHSNAYSKVNMFFDADAHVVRKAICGRDASGVSQAAKKLGWEHTETDWRKLASRGDVDVVDINAPSYLHKEMAIFAANEGKHIFCEKPLAFSTADAREIIDAANKNGVKHQIAFNFRFAPAVRVIRAMIESGRLGEIYHFRGHYLQDFIISPDFPKVWRLDKTVAGSGSLGDLGAHVIDLARYLVGDVKSVIGISKTFIKERPLPEGMTGLSGVASKDAPREAVDVDDATSFIGEFENGALLQIEATRFAAGNRNNLSFEINGSLGSVRFGIERICELEYYDAACDAGLQGFSTITVTEDIHPYAGHWWPAGHAYGYEHTLVHEIYEFVQSVANNNPTSPNFVDGMKCTQIMEAVDLSIERRAWVDVNSL
ncbi:MAG: Gfo/Idh/MocA family oxidoreductase [Oscillospiraceae bacterium]|nr:Gfo/Idh/MocA family oxidoreductase [Oscillospiraceae bacterium]